MNRRAALTLAVLLVAGGWRPLADSAQNPEANSQTVRIGLLKNGSYEVTTLPLEEYVARVLAGEALPGSPPAAMEALAIAIRTYTQTSLAKHKADGFDLCDQTHCQVMRAATPVTQRAAQATAGQILVYRGAPATIYYSASCGGRTEIPSAVWPDSEDPPYLPSRPDDGCGGGPLWTAELALSDLRRSFVAAGYLGALRDMKIASRDGSGRVAKLTLEGLTPNEVSGQDLRAIVGRTMGWQYIRSAAFEMRRSGDIFRMDGRGSGHGVGMCVIGSAKLAESGRSTMAILTQYYPGVEIGRFSSAAATASSTRSTSPATPPVAGALPATASSRAAAGVPAAPAAPGRAPAAAAMIDGIAVALPEDSGGPATATSDADRAALSTLAARDRDRLAKALDTIPPSRISLRVYATADEYQRATGRPWFTSGTVINNVIHLAPVAPLRDRGVLERTILQQVVHVLVDEILRDRPAWVREGAAQYFSESETASGAALSRTACPSDAELLRPVSPGALNNAYAQARGCFGRQVTSGRNWRDVK